MITWYEAVEKTRGILKFGDMSLWEIGDMLVELIPDGTPNAKSLVGKFRDDVADANGNNSVVKTGTFWAYYLTSLAWPKEMRVDNKPHTFHSQARSKRNRFDIVNEATSERHLRELLGQRNPYRVNRDDWLHNEQVVMEFFTPSRIRRILAYETIREKFVAELETTHGMMYVPFRNSYESQNYSYA